MVVDVDNWRRKASGFEALDDGVHVSPQGVCGPIHSLPRWISVCHYVPLGSSCWTILYNPYYGNILSSRSINVESICQTLNIFKNWFITCSCCIKSSSARSLESSESSVHLARVLDTKLLQSEALLFKDVDLALGPFLQRLHHCAQVEDIAGIIPILKHCSIKLYLGVFKYFK